VQAELDRLAAVLRLRDDHDPRSLEGVPDRTTGERIVVRDDRAQDLVVATELV
jgi:hypothetical protein